MFTTKMLSSSMPLGRAIWVMRSWMMNTALQTMARVSAICSAIRMAPVLLRSMALNIGRIPMGYSLLDLEVDGRRDAHHAPGGIQAGQHARDDSKQQRYAHHGPVQVRVMVAAVNEVAHADETCPTEQDAQQTATDADHPSLHQ